MQRMHKTMGKKAYTIEDLECCLHLNETVQCLKQKRDGPIKGKKPSGSWKSSTLKKSIVNLIRIESPHNIVLEKFNFPSLYIEDMRNRRSRNCFK